MIQSSSSKGFKLIIQKNDYATMVVLLVFVTAVLVGATSLFTKALVVMALCLGISSSVHSAELVAKKIGASWGTLILALAVTIVEVALILGLMKLKTPGAATIARDTVFSSLMILTNGVIGACAIIGGIRYRELTFQTLGTSALLAVLVVLSTLTLVLPNYTTSSLGPTYTPGQLAFVSVSGLVVYALLILSQTRWLRGHFNSEQTPARSDIPSSRLGMSILTLLVSLVCVVGFSKMLSPSIQELVDFFGAPRSITGIIIAVLVLAPETLSAINSAKMNQLQESLNLALGSGVASIALTIPAISAFSIYNQEGLVLGIDHKSIIFLLLTFFAGAMTLGSGRSTALHGAVHILILFSYLAMSFMP